MQRRFRRVLTAVRENCFVSYAKIVTVGGFCDVDLIVIKATAPNDLPLPEKYVQELLKIFAFSPPSFRAFSLSFTRRFGNTRCWRVGLKCLVLLHRLLQSVPEDSAFRVELLRSQANGLMTLHQCYFRDDSSFASEDCSSFIRSYALLLDEALNCDSFYNSNAPEDSGEEVNGTITRKINEINRLLEILPQLQSLIDRVIECRPTGKAERSFAVRLAMKHVIRESFRWYRTLCKDIVSVQDNLLQMPYRSCVAAIGIYKKAAIQANQLSELYDRCKLIGICGLYEYPLVDRIPHTKIQTLETVISRMWQLFESSSSSSSSSSTPTTLTASPSESPISANDDPGNRVAAITRNIVISTQWEIFEDNDFPLTWEEKGKPLIELEASHESGWEDLLEASASLPCIPMNCNFNSYNWGQNPDGSDAWKILQLYNPSSLNPFHHACFIPNT